MKDDNTRITEIQNSMTEHDYLSKGMKIKRKKVDKNDIRLKCRDNLNWIRERTRAREKAIVREKIIYWDNIMKDKDKNVIFL